MKRLPSAVLQSAEHVQKSPIDHAILLGHGGMKSAKLEADSSRRQYMSTETNGLSL